MSQPTPYQAVQPYATRGWSIIPIAHGKKHNPSTFRGQPFLWKQFQQRRPTDTELRTWFGGDDCFESFAVILGPVSGNLACRDFDNQEAYDTWAEKYFEYSRLLPTVKTARGCHVYFQLAQDSPLRLKAAHGGKEPELQTVIDYTDGELRFSGCICLFPPSRHPSGHIYKWLIPLPEGPLVEIDPAEIGMEGTPKVTKDGAGKIIDISTGIPSGGRNDTLTRFAGALRRQGADPGIMADILHKLNDEKCNPPLPRDEVDNIVRSIGSKPTGEISRTAAWVRMDKVPREEVTWIWKPWIPRGKLVFLDGDPKVGKSFITAVLAAIISRGFAFPDENGIPVGDRKPENVIMMSAEDGLPDTIGPRLDSAGADCSRIYAMTGIRVREGAKVENQIVTLQDIPEIEALVLETGAIFVVVDPLQAYIGAKIKMDQANETRPVLAALGEMATRRNCTVFIVRHMRKSTGSAIHRGLGSIDFSAAARSIIMAARDPQDKDKRIMAHTACTNAKEAKSLRFEITESGGLMWLGTDERDADAIAGAEVGGRDTVAEKAATWLQKLLSDVGDMAANEIRAKARREGIGQSALSQAKSILQIQSEKHGPLWFWKL